LVRQALPEVVLLQALLKVVLLQALLKVVLPLVPLEVVLLLVPLEVVLPQALLAPHLLVAQYQNLKKLSFVSAILLLLG
jgi:hypothetical protein